MRVISLNAHDQVGQIGPAGFVTPVLGRVAKTPTFLTLILLTYRPHAGGRVYRGQS